MAIADLEKISKNENDFTFRIQSLSSLIYEMNAKTLKKLLTNKDVNPGSINTLQAFMNENYSECNEDMIINLRRIMTLRSKKYPVHKDSPDLLNVLKQMEFCEYPPDWVTLWEICLEAYHQSRHNPAI